MWRQFLLLRHDNVRACAVQNIEVERIEATPLKLVWLLPLLVPVFLFVVSLFIRPTIDPDSSTGFLAFRSMLQGGAFNYLTTPDPGNIANDSASFLRWWSPGQYLVPEVFIWLGADYYLAIALTTLISIAIGVIGWLQVARKFGASSFVIVCLLCGLVTFRYGTLPFQMWDGGEVLLFAAAPWCLYWLRWAIGKPPMICFMVALASAGLLFTAKLTGLIVFAADVLSLALLELMRQRRVTSVMIALGIASSVAALAFLLFWESRASVPANGSKLAVIYGTLPAIWFPIAAAAFSGVSGIDLLNLVLHNWSAPNVVKVAKYVFGPLGLLSVFWVCYKLRNTWNLLIIAGLFAVIALVAGAATVTAVGHDLFFLEQHYLRDLGLVVCGLLGLLLALWVWHRLRSTRYRMMAIGLFSIITFYTVPFIAMYVAFIATYIHGASISLEERHLRYAGILFFFLFLVTLDQWGTRIAKAIALLVVSVFALYGLTTYVVNARQLLQGRYYERLSWTIQPIVPTGVLDYLRSEMEAHNWQNAIAVVPREAALGLPRFRIIPVDLNIIRALSEYKWAGRVERIFVVVPEEALSDGKATVLLRDFADYDEGAWSKARIEGWVVYSQ
jgi:hypothetical protein